MLPLVRFLPNHHSNPAVMGRMIKKLTEKDKMESEIYDREVTDLMGEMRM